MKHKLEYIWLDGTEPTTQLRSKTKIVSNFGIDSRDNGEAPIWAFDGSSTNQAVGSDSDCVLKPVRLYPNSLEKGNNTLVLCEVWNVDNTPHETNTRHRLDITLQYLDDDTIDEWVGFEQEYTLFENGLPFGWMEQNLPHN